MIIQGADFLIKIGIQNGKSRWDTLYMHITIFKSVGIKKLITVMELVHVPVGYILDD